MLKRISFHIVYATSEDSSYPACELNTLGPAARGWRSEGAPPHELLLRLTSLASVHRLQLLAHHQLVPASVEVLVSGGLMSEGAATPCGATYTAVGKVSLATPAPEARNRELRSAALPEPTIARFVKLRLSGPHPPGNIDDQVALMAVNVLGEELDETTVPTLPRGDVTMSPYDDLSFLMYVDNDIADLIRRLDERKQLAVRDERFEYARRLKSASSALTVAGARIGRWSLRKRTAAACEEFELATFLRDRVHNAIEGICGDDAVRGLLEVDGINPQNDTSMIQDYDFSHHLSPSVTPGSISLDIPSPLPPDLPGSRKTPDCQLDPHDEDRQSPIQQYIEVEVAQFLEDGPPQTELQRRTEDIREELRRETDSPRRSVTPNSANGTLVRRRNKSAGPRSTYEAYEEIPLPALRHSQTNEFLRDLKDKDEETSSIQGSTVSNNSAGHRPPHKLTEKERKAVALPILIFGYSLVEKFFSKNFLDKEEGLARLRSELTSPSSDSVRSSPNKTARATATLLQRLLKDKVYSVFCQSNEVLKLLFFEYMPERVCAAEVVRCLERLLPELFRACGDPSPRVHSQAQHTILTLADCPHVRSLHTIPQQLARPLPAAMHPRLALSRLQMLEQLVLTHGFSTDKNSGLTPRRVSACAAASCTHAASAVRACAERLLTHAYRRAPTLVRQQLPPDDNVTRRNLVYRQLFQQFDRIDMQKMLQKAPSEEQEDIDQSFMEDAVSVSHSSRSGATTASRFTSLMNSSLGASTYSLKSMASSVSGATLAPSSVSGSVAPSSLSGSYSSATSTKTKSSLKKTQSKKFSSKKDLSIGYNKLRLDSAVLSPKHSPKTPTSGEKVHFQDTTQSEQVTLRRTSRTSEHRHSMIHYDHQPQQLLVKKRPTTVYEPLHLQFSNLNSPKTPRSEMRSVESINSPRTPRSEMRSEMRSVESLNSPRTPRSEMRSIERSEMRSVESLNSPRTPRSEMRSIDRCEMRSIEYSPRTSRSEIRSLDLLRSEVRSVDLNSPRTPKSEMRSADSLTFPRTPRSEIRNIESLNSPRSQSEMGSVNCLNSPKNTRSEMGSIEKSEIRSSESKTFPRTPKNEIKSINSLSDCNTNSPKSKLEFNSWKNENRSEVSEFKGEKRRSEVSTPDLAGSSPNVKSLNIDEGVNMEESGYYSPGETGRRQGRLGDLGFEFETGGEISSGGTTPELVCNAQCGWCGRRIRGGSVERHHAQRCVLLATCHYCHSTIEARALHVHVLEECISSRGHVKRCHRCGAALKIDDKDYHVNCIPLARDEWKCPYCLMNVLARDLPWQRHLMQCARNPRVAPGNS